MTALEPPAGNLRIACKFEEVVPEFACDVVSASTPGGYIKASGPSGKVHLRHATSPELTWCRWRWTKASRATVHQSAPRGKMCKRCTRHAVQQAAEASSE